MCKLHGTNIGTYKGRYVAGENPLIFFHKGVFKDTGEYVHPETITSVNQQAMIQTSWQKNLHDFYFKPEEKFDEMNAHIFVAIVTDQWQCRYRQHVIVYDEKANFDKWDPELKQQIERVCQGIHAVEENGKTMTVFHFR